MISGFRGEVVRRLSTISHHIKRHLPYDIILCQSHFLFICACERFVAQSHCAAFSNCIKEASSALQLTFLEKKKIILILWPPYVSEIGQIFVTSLTAGFYLTIV